jgi:L-ribulose-5-phosphate 4-epimerase
MSDTTSTDISAQVVAAAHQMYADGLVVGTAGNVSGRQSDGNICLTPSSTPYDYVSLDNLAVVDVDGNPVEGGNPSSEKAMHLNCYKKFPEVGGVVHCHPVHGSMFAVAGKPIPAVIEEVIVYIGGDVPVSAYATTGSDELAEEVVRHLGDRSAVLMANHGMICVGKSPADALHTAQVIEHTAKIVYGATVLGNVTPLPKQVVETFSGYYGMIRQSWGTG